MDLEQVKENIICKEVQEIVQYLLSSEKIKRQIHYLLRKKQPELHHDFNVKKNTY